MATPTNPTRDTDGHHPDIAWQNILREAGSDAEPGRVEAAMALAEDTVQRATGAITGSADVFHGELAAISALSRVALMWHRVLTDTDAFARSRASNATTCRFEPDEIRAWLTGTSPDSDATVAQSLRIGVDFDIYGFDKWERISNLVAQAQQAGVYGVADHTVDVLHLAGERGYVDRHRVTLNTPQHAVLCSDDLDTGDLFGDRYGVDAAIHVLDQVARAADRLLYQRAVLADVAWPTPDKAAPAQRPSPGKAFVPLATVKPAVATVAPPRPAAPTLNPRRHR
jgi:hypothetical protein